MDMIRTLDSIHVGCCLVPGILRFVCVCVCVCACVLKQETLLIMCLSLCIQLPPMDILTKNSLKYKNFFKDSTLIILLKVLCKRYK